MFIAVTLLLPRGIVGTWQAWTQRRRSEVSAPIAQPETQAAE
jgi:hypothetical protein